MILDVPGRRRGNKRDDDTEPQLVHAPAHAVVFFVSNYFQSHRKGHSESDIKVRITRKGGKRAAQCAHLAVRRTMHGAHTVLTTENK